MATDNGYMGSVSVAGDEISELNSWDITFDGGQADTTPFGSKFVERDYTIRSASGNISGNSDKSDSSGQDALISQFLDGGTPAAVWLYLYVSGSEGYYGEALVTPNRSAAATDKQKFSASFQSTGTWYQNIT